MSLNIAPHIPQVIANSAAPTTEALARANTVKEVVPAPTQVEPYAPQKSREQDARPPSNQSAVTYEGIQQQADSKVIPEEEQQGDPQQQSQQESEQESGQNEQQESQTRNSDADTQENEQEAAEKKIENRIEQAEQKAELAQIRQLEQRDAEVRAHEQAHAAVGGGHAGSPSYSYETGPNGKKYAVGGEVSIDVSKGSTPQETIRKMQTVRAAALAPAEPSSQDRKVAAEATRKLTEARGELIRESNDVQSTRSTPLNEAQEDESAAIQSGNVNQSNFGPDDANRVESDIASLKHRDDFVNRTANVVADRYASSYQQLQNDFNAVA